MSTAQLTRYALEESGPHPMGVLPLGNLLLFVPDEKPAHGYFARLSDEVLVTILGNLSSTDLGRLGQTCRALYCWCAYDELWKRFVIEEWNGRFQWQGRSWRETYWNCVRPVHSNLNSEKAQLALKGFRLYSDLLYQSWIYAHMTIPLRWLRRHNIGSCRIDELSVDEFRLQYDQGSTPLLIKHAASKWPALKKWTRPFLEKACGQKLFRAEAMDLPLCEYFKYAHSVREESPMYLFDKHFAHQCPEMLNDFEVPAHFQQDFFELLGPNERPDYRWLIIGPRKSGSSFHKDPNGTSAWNVTLCGRKKWIFYPPHVNPPGVHPSADGSQVATPVSLMEWFSHYYAQVETDPQAIECVAEEGDLVFVPSGWWHLVLNLEPLTMALTQNFVSEANLLKVVSFLKHKQDQISGVGGEEQAITLGQRFTDVLERSWPGLLDRLRKEQKRALEDESDFKKVKRQSFWQKTVTDQRQEKSSDFVFNFDEEPLR